MKQLKLKKKTTHLEYNLIQFLVGILIVFQLSIIQSSTPLWLSVVGLTIVTSCFLNYKFNYVKVKNHEKY